MHLRALSLAAVAAVLIVCAQLAQASVRDSGGSPLAAVSAAINADLTGSRSLDSSAVTVEKSRHAVNSHADRLTVTTTVSSEVTTQQTDRDNDPADLLANLKPVSTPDVLTSSARPGWGCGDTNHDHTGPPGRPDATPPPNCTKP
jgi:hypothetical protein